MNIMRQSACDPIKVDSYGFFFNCTADQASDLMTAMTLSFNSLVDV